MRSVLLATVAAAATFAAATAALAGPEELTSNAFASVSGGCACGAQQNQTLVTSNASQTLTSTAQDQNAFGSFGHATVTTLFGEQHVYADAFQAPGDPGPDVQTHAFSQYVEDYAPGAFGAGVYNMSFAVTGSMSVEPQFGPGSDAFLQWEVIDRNIGGVITSGIWVAESGDPVPVIPFIVPLGHASELQISFTASAFSENRLADYLIFADYQHTVHTYIDAVGGGSDVIGLSGHDYATPSAAVGVPEPAAWALMLAGFGLMGSALRRRTASA